MSRSAFGASRSLTEPNPIECPGFPELAAENSSLSASCRRRLRNPIKQGLCNSPVSAVCTTPVYHLAGRRLGREGPIAARGNGASILRSGYF